MRLQFALAVLVLLGTVSTACAAGGPPPMYVVVEKVVHEPHTLNPRWVQIWGCITRSCMTTDSAGQHTERYSQPTYGYLYLRIDANHHEKTMAEIEQWKRAAGTGKAVAVGACLEAGSFLKCTIHKPSETATAPDASYTPGHLKVFGDLYATGGLADREEVKALLKFAKERK
ncbi:MAG: hypothetical protein JNJ77_06735 [Planctomycetia bacterium]|nr:hypothetical protein [Planctomycetia bacterium]